MAFTLHSIRKYQKPLIFGLAVFLMIAFGVPWSDVFRQDRGSTDRVYITIRGREVRVSEFLDFRDRWVKVNPRLREYDVDELHSYIQQQMVLVDEAERAGLTVPAEQIRQALMLQGPLLRGALVEVAKASDEDFTGRVEVADDEIEAYYNSHKDDFLADDGQAKELENVRVEIKEIIAGQKAQQEIAAAIGGLRKALAEAGEMGNTAFKDASGTHRLAYSSVYVLDHEQAIEQQLESFGDAKDKIAKRAFSAKLGEVFGPFDVDGGSFIFRIASRSPGFTANGAFCTKLEGWLERKFGVVEEIGYATLAARVYAPFSAKDVEQTLRENLLVERYRDLLGQSVGVPSDTLEQNYYKNNEKVRVDYLTFSAGNFMSGVEVTDAEVEALFNQYKDVPEPQYGGPGYMQPPMASVEYIMAVKPKPESAVYTDAQLNDYYNSHKDNYDKPYDEVKEQVKADMAEAEFAQLVNKLLDAKTDIDNRIITFQSAEPKNQLTPPEARIEETAAAFPALVYKKTGQIRQDGRDLYKMGNEFMRDRNQVLEELFNDRHLTDLELQTGDPELLHRKNVTSQVLELSDGSKYFFHVAERQPAKVLTYTELPPDILNRVRRDRQTQKAVELAKTEAGKMAAILRAETFDAVAADLDVEPTTSARYEIGALPEGIAADSAVGKAAVSMKPGDMKGIVADGGVFNILLCEAGDAEGTAVLKTLSFPASRKIAGPELSDSELAAWVSDNIERYASIVPPKGTAGIEFIGAKYADLEKDIEPTDDEIAAYHAAHKDDRFEGKALDEVREDVTAAVKADKARAEAGKLLDAALAEAKEDTKKPFKDIVKDTPLITEYVTGIKLNDMSDKEFVGKAEGLAAAILATKGREIAEGMQTTDEGMFFFKVAYKSPAEAGELWAEMADDGKEGVKQDLRTEHLSGTELEQARRQLGRYAVQAAKQAPDNHHIITEKQIKPMVQADKQLSLRESSRLSEETVETLLAMKPGSLSEAIHDNDRANLFLVKDVQPLKAAKMEYIKVSPYSFAQYDENEDWQVTLDRGKALARQAAQRIHAATEGKPTLAAALAEVQADIKPLEPLKAAESPYFTAGTSSMADVGYNIELFKKVFDMKLGEVAPIYEENNDLYIIRPLNVKEVSEAKFSYVNVYPVNFVTAEVGAEAAAAKAEEAMKAFREEAAGKGSLADALEVLQKAMPEGRSVSVRNEEDFDLSAPPQGWGGREALLEALSAAKPGDVTAPVKIGAAIYVARLDALETPKSVVVDWAYLNQGDFANADAVPNDAVKAYYNEHMEDYRRDEEREIAYFVARPDSFKEDLRKSVTDDMLKEYFNANIARYQHPDPEGNVVTAEFEEAKPQVKNDYVNEKAETAAREALDAAKEAMATEEADLEAIADEHKLEQRNLGFLSKTGLVRERELSGIPRLADDVYALDKGAITDIKAKESDLYIFKVLDVKESFIPEFDEVASKARTDTDRSLQPERAIAAIKTIREQAGSAINEGKTFAEAVEKMPVTFDKHSKVADKSTGAFARLSYNGTYGGRVYYSGGPSSADVPGLPGNEKRFRFTSTAFDLAPGEISGPVLEDNERQSVFLMALSDRIEPEPPTEEQLENARMSMEYVLRSQNVEETINRIMAESLRILIAE